MSIYAKAEIDRLRGEVEAGHRREAALTETIAMVRRQLDEERGTVDTYALFLDAVRESLALPDGEPAPYGYLAGHVEALRKDRDVLRQGFDAVSEDAGRYVEALEKMCQCVTGQTCPACIALGKP